MFSMPIALLRRELKGPDFFLVGLFPGMIKDCRREQEGPWAKDSYRNTFTLWWSPRGLKGNFKENTSSIGQVYVIPLAIVVYYFFYLRRAPVFLTLFRSLTGRVDVKCAPEGFGLNWEMKDGSRISWASLGGCTLAGDTLFSSSLSAGSLQLLLYDFKWKAFKKAFI